MIVSGVEIDPAVAVVLILLPEQQGLAVAVDDLGVVEAARSRAGRGSARSLAAAIDGSWSPCLALSIGGGGGGSIQGTANSA